MGSPLVTGRQRGHRSCLYIPDLASPGVHACISQAQLPLMPVFPRLNFPWGLEAKADIPLACRSHLPGRHSDSLPTEFSLADDSRSKKAMEVAGHHKGAGAAFAVVSLSVRSSAKSSHEPEAKSVPSLRSRRSLQQGLPGSPAREHRDLDGIKRMLDHMAKSKRPGRDAASQRGLYRLSICMVPSQHTD